MGTSLHRIADIHQQQAEAYAKCAQLESQQRLDYMDEIKKLSEKESKSLRSQAVIGALLAGTGLFLQITNEFLPSDYDPLKQFSSDKNVKKIPISSQNEALDLAGLLQTEKTIPEDVFKRIKEKRYRVPITTVETLRSKFHRTFSRNKFFKYLFPDKRGAPHLSSQSAGLDLAGLSQTKKTIPTNLFKKIEKKQYCLPISKKISNKNESRFKEITKIVANGLPSFQHPLDKLFQFIMTPIKTNQYFAQIRVSHVMDQHKRTQDFREKDQHVLSIFRTAHEANSTAARSH